MLSLLLMHWDYHYYYEFYTTIKTLSLFFLLSFLLLFDFDLCWFVSTQEARESTRPA